MNELKFNSQVCTTKIQSQRLLDLGLKPETADMYITNMSKKGINYTDDYQIGSISFERVMSFCKEKGLTLENTAWEIIPAWSLHRLMEIAEMDCFNSVATAYDEVIREIKFQHGEGYINKEYLKL